ncbi:unnamed protein product [Rotaria sordida]|uniref:Saposin B type region 2 domain-containing protein n=1 Tax=Rotaria sordida TaxID=392033 RepID=A0A815XWL3_9BILA|nr:unnamed protein product [Rotaria sordida]CAF1562519.1 unnamed protein product [Rotaria sordida]
MMKASLEWIFLIFAILLPVINGLSIKSIDGGSDCASCTIIVGLVEKLSIVYNESIRLIFLGPIIIDGFMKEDSPDIICHALKFCTDDPGQAKCRLYLSKSPILFTQHVLNLHQQHSQPSYDLSTSKIFDFDQDRFGSEPTFRGSSWRRKDCNDFSSAIHPGARIVQGDAIIDHNCNGIYGINSATGRSWEEEFCNETQRMGSTRLFDLDHCNHRDYQNIAVTGADSKSILDIAKTLRRNLINDVPLLVIYSLVGNDVCNGHPNTLDDMATVEEMYSNILNGLAYLDTILPKGSHVLTTGLANGNVLYQLLDDLIHTFGRIGIQFTYKKIYTYLSCLQISPCNGWLTSNDTLRAIMTRERLKSMLCEMRLDYRSWKNYL